MAERQDIENRRHDRDKLSPPQGQSSVGLGRENGTEAVGLSKKRACIVSYTRTNNRGRLVSS